MKNSNSQGIFPTKREKRKINQKYPNADRQTPEHRTHKRQITEQGRSRKAERETPEPQNRAGRIFLQVPARKRALVYIKTELYCFHYTCIILLVSKVRLSLYDF